MKNTLFHKALDLGLGMISRPPRVTLLTDIWLSTYSIELFCEMEGVSFRKTEVFDLLHETA